MVTVDELITAVRMRPAGMAEVDAAKADGSWAAACESLRSATVPSDLASIFKAGLPAAKALDALSKTQRFDVIRNLLEVLIDESLADER